MFKKIYRLTWTPIVWSQAPGRERIFVTEKYPMEDCFIRLNDFPHEPLWTLSFKGDTLDLEDTTIVWEVSFEIRNS
jgi:hypothetical protein